MMETLGYFGGVSTDTQQFLLALLSDKPFLDQYFSASSRRLAACFKELQLLLVGEDVKDSWGSEQGDKEVSPAVRLLPSYAGIFAFVDLRSVSEIIVHL
jgi:hypothetical protein